MAQLKEYTKKAINKYKAKFDIISGVQCPKGTKDRIRALGFSLNEFCVKAILKELKRLEKKQAKEDHEKIEH